MTNLHRLLFSIAFITISLAVPAVASDLEKEKRWREVVRKFRESGLSVRKYCQANNISESSLHWWRREIERRDAEEKSKIEPDAPTFAEVRIIGEKEPDPDSGISIILPDGPEIQLKRGFDETTLLRVIEVLENARC